MDKTIWDAFIACNFEGPVGPFFVKIILNQEIKVLILARRLLSIDEWFFFFDK